MSTSKEWKAMNLWQPCAELMLSMQYHPAVSPDHPAFGKLPMLERTLAEAIHKQDERWSHKRYFKGALSGRLIAVLNGYTFAGKLCDCMMKRNRHTKSQPFSRCNQDWFCTFCAYLKQQDMLKKYAGAWQPDSWYQMVLSLEAGICPAEPEHDTIREVLDAMTAVVKRLQEAKQMRGYIAWIEIVVHQFYPHLIVTPHIHVLLRCDYPPDKRAIGLLVADTWISRQLEAVPDLLIEPVKSEAHFYKLLQYIEPIDLLDPYHRGHVAARAAGRLDFFHQEVREFFYALSNDTRDYQVRYSKQHRRLVLMPVTMRRFLYGGICHGSSGQPLGLKLALRRTLQHQDAIKAKVEIAREVEQIAQTDAEQKVEQ